jgi:putative ABC transport system permease protein
MAIKNPLHNPLHNPNVIPMPVLVHMAWRNLMHKKLRAFLTIFGVVIGIGAIFFLLSFGLGLQKLVTNEVIGNQSIKSIDVSTPNSRILKLDQTNFDKMKNLPRVTRVGSLYSYAGSLKAQGSEVDSIVYGEDENYQAMNQVDLVTGRKVRANDNNTIAINQATVRALGYQDADSAINKKLSLRVPIPGLDEPREITETMTIVGVMAGEGGNEVYIPNGLFAAAEVPAFSQIKVEADSADDVGQLRKQIESLGFLTTSPIDTVDQINQVFKFFNVILAGFGAVGMVVAVLGMFNTLTISLLERTKEVGLMITLGGRNRDMRKLFVLEAVLLSFSGAVFGILTAVTLGQIINLIMNAFARGRGVTDYFQLFSIPIWLVLSTIIFMLMVGLAVVYLPARRASRINPIDALRRE